MNAVQRTISTGVAQDAGRLLAQLAEPDSGRALVQLRLGVAPQVEAFAQRGAPFAAATRFRYAIDDFTHGRALLAEEVGPAHPAIGALDGDLQALKEIKSGLNVNFGDRWQPSAAQQDALSGIAERLRTLDSTHGLTSHRDALLGLRELADVDRSTPLGQQFAHFLNRHWGSSAEGYFAKFRMPDHPSRGIDELTNLVRAHFDIPAQGAALIR